MQKLTNKDMDMAFERYARALESLNIQKLGHRLEYQAGSRVNGRSYTVCWVNISNGGRSPALGTDFGGYVGTTKRQAFETMNNMARTLEDVAFLQHQLEMP